MARIFVTRKIPNVDSLLEELKKGGFEVEVSDLPRPLTNGELAEKIKGNYDGIITLLTDRIDGDLMDLAGPQLKIVSNYAVGFDNIDVKAATDRQIVVANTPSDEVNRAVAEHTWALILGLARRVVEADEAVRRGGYHGWEPEIFLGTELNGKTLGIVGLGRIGTMVAQIGVGFGMNILYNKSKPDPEAEAQLKIRFASLSDLLAQSDFVTLHVPLTDETRHMINKATLNQMKTGSYLINTARGPVVNEMDLIEAIKSAKLKGAALDVFDNEPNVSPELIGMENVILTPHIASATIEARNKMGKGAVDAILDAFAGKKPQNIVNEEVWEKRRK